MGVYAQRTACYTSRRRAQLLPHRGGRTMLVMAKDKPKSGKRTQKTDRHTQPRMAFHAKAELLAALDRYVADQEPETTGSAVVRLALERFLVSEGYWPPKE